MTWRTTLPFFVVVFALGGLFQQAKLKEPSAARSLKANGSDDRQISTDQGDTLRYLVFGTSRSWGVGPASRNLAYPYLLSKDVKNNAIRGTGPNYPFMCTYSMVGDEVYDVIIFEFYYILEANEKKLVHLAKRLRQRFPNAMMIFMKNWLPGMYRHKPSDTFLREIVSREKIEFNSETMRKVTAGTVSDDWEFYPQEDKLKHFNEAKNAVGGIVFELPHPGDHVKALTEFARFFTRDMNHYNEAGHAVIAEGIRSLVRHHGVIRNDNVNPWSLLDSCDKWYETGQVHLQHSQMNMMDLGYKYALEVEPTGSWFKVTNPMTVPAKAVLYFLSYSPDPLYPKTRVAINDSEADGVIVEPLNAFRLQFATRLHLMKGKYIGMVPPGESTLYLQPLETTKHKFRVAAIVVTQVDIIGEDK